MLCKLSNESRSGKMTSDNKCKNCETIYKKYIEKCRSYNELESEIKDLSRRYTKSIHTIDLLHRSESE